MEVICSECGERNWGTYEIFVPPIIQLNPVKRAEGVSCPKCGNDLMVDCIEQTEKRERESRKRKLREEREKRWRKEAEAKAFNESW